MSHFACDYNSGTLNDFYTSGHRNKYSTVYLINGVTMSDHCKTLHCTSWNCNCGNVICSSRSRLSIFFFHF